LPILEVMVHEGLIAISDVEVIRYTHRESQSKGDDVSHAR